ncbi:MAG: hypothetical protein ABL857_04025 [Rickettsiales bacterium]
MDIDNTSNQEILEFHNMMIGKTHKKLDEYYKREKWAIYEAAAILGAKWDILEKKPVEEITDKKTSILIDQFFGLYMETASTDTERDSYTHDYYYNPKYETDVYYHGKITPQSAVQQAVNLGFNIPSIIKDYLRNNGLLPAPEEGSQIKRLYKKWMNMKLWSLDEASKILFEIDPEESSYFNNYDDQPVYTKNSVEQFKKYLQRAALIGDIESIKHDDIYMKPTDVINWSSKNNYTIPYLLVEELNKINVSNIDSTKSKKQNAVSERKPREIHEEIGCIIAKIKTPKCKPKALDVWNHLYKNQNDIECVQEITNNNETGEKVIYWKSDSGDQNMTYDTFCNLVSSFNTGKRKITS